ncbi:hypothetical protein E6O75_ATG02662 [Venturia nashicola]|uniref:Uncharacterized protein n=1 Tax=Venturia nashicola TaxID=86259 RepID=A0A4Z1P5S6_9PEZI|nr:hypothetical protein E6O75_ATG02662 [Venturia nashicola]
MSPKCQFKGAEFIPSRVSGELDIGEEVDRFGFSFGDYLLTAVKNQQVVKLDQLMSNGFDHSGACSTHWDFTRWKAEAKRLDSKANTSDTQGSFVRTKINTPPTTIATPSTSISASSSCARPTMTDNNTSSIPWPGDVYILRSKATGEVLTLNEGKTAMVKPGGRDSIHWACVEKGGWLGFRNPVSGKFLGHDRGGYLICNADVQRGWERFCVRMKPDEGFVLYMTQYDDLWPVGLKEVPAEVKKGEKARKGDMRLAKIEKGKPMIWEFVKV